LPKFRPQMPWFGYSLRSIGRQLDQEAEFAVQRRDVEIGEKLKTSRFRVPSPELTRNLKPETRNECCL
jgi:hypothetical protein